MNTVIYPVIFEKDNDGYLVTIPDLDTQTQGADFVEAINMARDLISLWVMNLEDMGKEVPKPNTVNNPLPVGAVVSYVDANISEYRKKYGYKTVKKNCTIPAWLNTKAEEMNINFSQVLQDALIEKINA
jgi:predicted RNase H-like HicB family nuclease|nr:MAG TPA: HicB-like antitoxin [Caudoviricetes sp.]